MIKNSKLLFAVMFFSLNGKVMNIYQVKI